jgi:hypothetical protein
MSPTQTKGLVVLVALALIAALGFAYRTALSEVLTSAEHTVDYGGGKVHFVQADKRAVFVFHERSKAGFACPEPSPDVRSAVERAVKALTEAQAKLPQGGSAELKQTGEATNKVATESLMERTQGLQVLRDMLFQACLANVRGDMSGVQYVNFVSITLPRLTTSLIATELLTRQETEKFKLSSADLQVFLNFLVLNQ